MMFWLILEVLFAQDSKNSDTPMPIRALKPMIAHGYTVNKIEDFSFSAYFLMFGQQTYACGASILHQKILLTTAHCIIGYSGNLTRRVLVRVGSIYAEKGDLYAVKAMIPHEEFYIDEIYNDIGLITVERDIAIGPKASRVVLSTTSPKAGLVGSVAGWGYSHENSSNNLKVLLYTKQKIMPFDKCQDLIDDMILDKVFCAGVENATSYPTQGDSGSALVLNGNMQIGIVSFRVTHTGITAYTDVSQYIHWIQVNMKHLLDAAVVKN